MSTTAIQQMGAEHRHIESVINFVQSSAAALEAQQPVDTAKLRTAAEFFRVYADQRHHQREEAIFFPVLIKRGVPPRGCPIGGLNYEHEKGRGMLNALLDQLTAFEEGKADARAALLQSLQDIAKLYRHHLWMEDAMVFPMAEKIVTEEDNREMLAKFSELDASLGADLVARMESFAQSLA